MQLKEIFRYDNPYIYYCLLNDKIMEKFDKGIEIEKHESWDCHDMPDLNDGDYDDFEFIPKANKILSTLMDEEYEDDVEDEREYDCIIKIRKKLYYKIKI
jgi:hypothetical protein